MEQRHIQAANSLAALACLVLTTQYFGCLGHKIGIAIGAQVHAEVHWLVCGSMVGLGSKCTAHNYKYICIYVCTVYIYNFFFHSFI